MTLQETYNHFITSSNIESWEWYNSLKKYTEILQEIKQKAKLDFYKSYKDLNADYKKLTNDPKGDFLDRYIFRKNNGLSEIAQQLVTRKRRREIIHQINLSFSPLECILKENDKETCLKLILEFIDQNKWTVANRFLRALFPNDFTSIDSYNHFELLKKKLKKDFDISVNTRNVIDKNKFTISLISFDDIYKAQIFFWMLKINQISSLKNSVSNKNNTMITNQMDKKTPLNQILYGPPGTGKTYHTINKAISIANPGFNINQDRLTLKKEYDRLVEIGQIVFTSFHQSMSYEDFIEGIKPDVKNNDVIYDTVPGIFVELCNKAKDNFDSSKDTNLSHLPFEIAFLKLKDEWEEDENIEFPLKTKGKEYTIIGFTKKSIQFKKASGSTSHTLSINTLKEHYYNNKEVKKSGVGIYYPAILEKLYSYPNEMIHKKEILNYVLIIDEINRGNISQIFGELITLIEESKRLGNLEGLEAVLPYSKEKFGVPSNLFILGTMNTADRSVEALDTALRRRFHFEEMLPKDSLLSPSAMYCRLLWRYKDVGWDDQEFIRKESNLFELLGVSEQWEKNKVQIWDKMIQAENKNIDNYFSLFSVSGINLRKILEKINERIEILLDRDHRIGHSYFIDVNSFRDLKSVFQNNIIPLLQEYFYNDYEKMGWVLGEGFFIERKFDNKNVFTKFFKQPKPEFELGYDLVDFDKIDIQIALQKLMGNYVETKQPENIES